MNKYKILKEYENNLMFLMDILGSTTTNDSDLNKIGIYLFGKKKFVGVFPSDQVPLLKNNQCCIINTDDSKHSGIHWCSLYRYNKKYYFYDSYSRDYKKLSPFWKKKRWINANKSVDQAITEKDCGCRSLSWLISFDLHHDSIISII